MSKQESKVANAEWVATMKKDYPNFSSKKWASNSYRLAHPQRSIE